VVACVKRGVAVYHGDMLEGMRFYRDHSFDVVVLSQTLQQTSDPVRVIREMLRVGETAIISFPTGHMPRNGLLPYAWYDTPNVHLCTVADFRVLCGQQELERVHEIFLVPPSRQISPFLANWRAGLAIFQLRKA
jgi:methionine biosynthesis protein MetW